MRHPNFTVFRLAYNTKNGVGVCSMSGNAFLVYKTARITLNGLANDGTKIVIIFETTKKKYKKVKKITNE